MSRRDQVIATLVAARPSLERRGVAHLWLFGSLARGDDHADSDVDLVFEMRDGRPIDIVSWGAMTADLVDLLGVRVDVGPLSQLKAPVDAAARRDMVAIF